MIPSILISLVLLLACPGLVYILYRTANSRGDTYFSVIYLGLALGALLGEALAYRSHNVWAAQVGLADVSGALTSVQTGASSLITRVIALSAVALAISRILLEFLQARRVRDLSDAQQTCKHRGSAKRIYLVALLVFFIGTYIFPSLLSHKPGLNHHNLFGYLLLLSVGVSSASSAERVIYVSKISLAALCVTSVFSSVYAPEFAQEVGYKGVLPLLGVRLYGLASHPNTLGPAALCLIILELQHPSGNIASRALILISSGLCFVFAQSKTAFVAAAISVFPVVLTSFISGKPRQKKLGRSVGGAALWLIFYLCLLLALTAYVVIGLYGHGASSGDELTGRTVLWRIAIGEFASNPIFGYGLSIFDASYRAEIGLDFAGQAHNQFIQSVAESGLIGLGALLLYIGNVSFLVGKSQARVQMTAFLLMIVLLTRMFTEVPFRNVVITEWAFLLHMTIVGLIISGTDACNEIDT